MPIPILMPALSPTMKEGTLAKWLKREGDLVESGDVIAEIETDKATMEVEAVEEGTLARILVSEGSEAVPVNQVIALLLEEGEDETALDAAAAAAVLPRAEAPPAPTEGGYPVPDADRGRAVTPVTAPVPETPGRRIFASPLARRMARETNLDLAAVTGSGPGGRIVKRDIEAAAAAQPTAAAAMPSSPAPPPPVLEAAGMPPHEAIPNTSMRKVIARRLVESKREIPHFYLTIDCELDKLLALRRELNDRSEQYRISVNDFVIRAVALALKKVPAANAAWTDEATLRFRRADIAVAVAVEGGLITPVIRNAEAKGLVEISGEMKDLAGRARAGTLMPEDYQGGTFTLSNLGMLGIKEFAAVINPPQACILAVGAGEQRAVVKDGALAIATVMSCTLSVDHRAVDGAVGAEFLAAFKPLVEDPLTMLL